MIFTPSFSSSLLAIGIIAWPSCRTCSMLVLQARQVEPSSSGTSPDTVVSGAPPMSTWPERTRRITSGPCTFISG